MHSRQGASWSEGGQVQRAGRGTQNWVLVNVSSCPWLKFSSVRLNWNDFNWGGRGRERNQVKLDLQLCAHRIKDSLQTQDRHAGWP